MSTSLVVPLQHELLSPQLVTCSTDPENSQHLVNSLSCGDLVRWKNSTVNAHWVPHPCPSAHMSGRVDSHGCYKFDKRSCFGFGTSGPICSSSGVPSPSAIPLFPDPAVSCVVSKHNKEDLSANMTKKRERARERRP